MAHAIRCFGKHTWAFAQQCLGADLNNKEKDVKNFIGTAARVAFAVAVFFTVRAAMPLFSPSELSVLFSLVLIPVPEVGLGLGAYLLSLAARQFLAASSGELVLYGAINVISVLAAWMWYDHNYEQPSFVSRRFDWLAEKVFPYVPI